VIHKYSLNAVPLVVLMLQPDPKKSTYLLCFGFPT